MTTNEQRFVDRAIADSRLIRGQWRRMGDDGREYVCLLVALAQRGLASAAALAVDRITTAILDAIECAIERGEAR